MAVLISVYRNGGLTWRNAILKYQEQMQFTDEIFDYKAIERSYERILKKAKIIFSKTVGE